MEYFGFEELTTMMTTGAFAGNIINTTPRYQMPKSPVKKGEKLFLSNASVIDVIKGEVKKDCGILIQNGKIAGIFEKESSPPSTDKTMDICGAYVMPGIINAHCHMSLPGGLGLNPAIIFVYKRQLERNAEECIKNGVTTVRDMLAMSNWLTELIDKIDKGEVVGPRILRSCAIDISKGYGEKMVIKGKPEFWKIADNPQSARDAVRAAVDEGADLIKLFQQPVTLLLPSKSLPVMDIPTIQAICDEALKHGKMTAMHQTQLDGLKQGLNGNVPCLEHMFRDQYVNDEDLKSLQESGATVVPTASASFGLAHQSHGDPNWDKGELPNFVELRKRIMPKMIDRFLEPVLAKSSHKIFKKLTNPKTYDNQKFIPWPNAKHFTAAMVVGNTNAKAYYDAGIPMGCGNDGGIPFSFAGSMAVEMLLLEKLGMKTSHILQMATINNARILGIENEVGVIEEGKIADMAIFKDDPLKTVNNLFDPMMVFMAGRLAFMEL